MSMSRRLWIILNIQLAILHKTYGDIWVGYIKTQAVEEQYVAILKVVYLNFVR